MLKPSLSGNGPQQPSVQERRVPPRGLKPPSPLKTNRSAVTVVLMVGGLTPVPVRCSWNARGSSGVAVSGGPAEEGCEPPGGTDVLALRIGRESADAHVLEHPLAQRADGLLAHRGACLEVGVLDLSILKTEHPLCHPRSINRLLWST